MELFNQGKIFRALVPPYEPVAYLAADLRARYNLRTPDAIQIATAILTGCDAFLTNDDGLRRVSAEMPVIIMHEIDPNVPVP